MKNILYKLAISGGLFLGAFGIAWAAGLTVPQGGTGWTGFVAGTIPIGPGTGTTALRFATSSGLTFATSTNTLTVTYASTTAVSGTSFCISTDCRTAWPTVGSFPFTPTTYSGVTVNSTSSPVWFTATSPFSLIASSTFITNASSTQLTVSGSTWIGSGTGFAILTSGLVSAQSFPCTLAQGCTNATSFTTTNNSVYYDGTRLVTSGTSQAVTTHYASTTAMSASGRAYSADTVKGWSGPLSPTHTLVIPFATSTVTWTATSTAGVDVAPPTVMTFAGTIKQFRCSTNSFLGVNIKVNSTSIAPSYSIASSTIGTTTATGSNTFTLGDTILLTVGTTTSATVASGVVYGSCSIDVTEN